jgi:uncharacterized protein
MRGTLPLVLQGEALLLHPERAVIWHGQRTLIVADTHFGKSSFFGRHGIPVPKGSDEGDRARLTALVEAAGAKRLIVLGDFLHAPLSSDQQEALDIDAWARALSPVRITVIIGNHDRGTARLSPLLEWYESELVEPPFCFRHDVSPAEARRDLFTLSGHVHPVTRLGMSSKQRLRVPVFWQRRKGLVLPSFGAFTGGFVVRPDAGERLFAVGPSAVTRIETGD